MMDFLFNPQGRVSRKDYWVKFVLMYMVVYFILSLLDAILMGATGGFPVLTSVFSLIMLWPSIAVTTKRLHDRSMSGWWQLVPFVALVVAFLPGHPGRNKYGQNPLEPEDGDLGEVFG